MKKLLFIGCILLAFPLIIKAQAHTHANMVVDGIGNIKFGYDMETVKELLSSDPDYGYVSNECSLGLHPMPLFAIFCHELNWNTSEVETPSNETFFFYYDYKRKESIFVGHRSVWDVRTYDQAKSVLNNLLRYREKKFRIKFANLKSNADGPVYGGLSNKRSSNIYGIIMFIKKTDYSYEVIEDSGEHIFEDIYK